MSAKPKPNVIEAVYLGRRSGTWADEAFPVDRRRKVAQRPAQRRTGASTIVRRIVAVFRRGQ